MDEPQAFPRADQWPYDLNAGRSSPHWPILALRAGTPVRIVQIQLGHSAPLLTLGTYGAFIPNAEDRAHWREHVAAAEAKRREVL